jgi:NADP-dependent 3-hydroxy acid dehydrogenase YdfG
MSKTIAIVGAGPGVGLAVAQRFGREGYKAALISRNQQKLNALVDILKADGIDAHGFAADVLDRPALSAALAKANKRFKSIDVLEYSPTGTGATLLKPTAMTEENEQYHLDMNVLGAITAVRAVLPGMLERGNGGLLFSTAASSHYPVAFTASFGVAAGAALNYARVLYQELGPMGIYAGIISIAGYVVQKGEDTELAPNGLSRIAAQDIADMHWNMFVKRDTPEAFAGDVNLLIQKAKQ